ncbi:hypothetical protein T265_08426 [Opisthorchis viverrini]|uniref:Uncharacterized protein n=1 Tax=Opisthorchis viverrini TaxID=6198 RepID=A0A075A8H5_OPIVI|nr:hypothetical protein T265_08426 [Opisthorchis viverrini]KER23774.1 hypothetical protein T265_08426 [Opisthorchis viverrini]
MWLEEGPALLVERLEANGRNSLLKATFLRPVENSKFRNIKSLSLTPGSSSFGIYRRWSRLASLEVSLDELKVQEYQTGPTGLFAFKAIINLDGEKLCKVLQNESWQDIPSWSSRLRKCRLSQHHPRNADKLSRGKDSGAHQSLQPLLRLADKLYPSCGSQTALLVRLEQYSALSQPPVCLTGKHALGESSSSGFDKTIDQTASHSSDSKDYRARFQQAVDHIVSPLESSFDN